MRAKRTLQDKILEPYKHLFEDNDIQIEFLYGTRDSGKTKAGSQLVLYEYTKTGKDFKCILIRKVKDTIKDSIYDNVKSIIEEWKLDDYFDSSKNPMEIRSKIDNGIFLCRGLDEPGKLKSLMNPTTALVEEADQITEDDLTMLLTTMRHNKIKVKLILMFNPEIPKGVKSKDDWWLYRDWFSHTSEKSFTHTKEISYYENGIERKYSIKYRATHTTFEDNPFCTPERKAFYYDLKNTNPEKYLPYAKGEWGVKEVKSPALLNFDRSKHLGDVSFNPRHPLIFWSDFNCNPLVTLVTQVYRDETGHHIHIIDAIALKDKRTPDLINHIKTSFSPYEMSRCLWTGDSTGNNAHTSSNLTNWEQINTAFKLGRRLKLPSVNPNVLASLENVDYILYNHPDFKINKKLENLIFEIEYTQKDDKGLIKTNRSDDAQKADLLDCVRYGINTFCYLENNCVKNPAYFGIR